MRTIILSSDGHGVGTNIYDEATGEKLTYVKNIKFDDLDCENFWHATLNIYSDHISREEILRAEIISEIVEDNTMVMLQERVMVKTGQYMPSKHIPDGFKLHGAL
jgi:antibiotic biosynthesis monooxygenase (ABM) superfamily enzyme